MTEEKDKKTIFDLLDISINDTEETIFKKYRKKIYELHPTRGGTTDDFINLVETYKTFLKSGDNINCLEQFFVDSFVSYSCRCGFEFINQGEIGIVECEYCSCYIIVYKPAKKIGCENF